MLINIKLIKCHICRSTNILLVEEFAQLALVTSDCRPWKNKNGKLGICRCCGFVQKIVDNAFISDCEEIYRTYAVYYQADGQEQKVFDQSKGLSQSRSESILVQVRNQALIPEAGTLLDVGCGNGNLLRSFSKLYPSWNLSGLEYDDQNRSCIEKINNVSAFYSCDLSAIAEQFDMISMIHCLEHIINPVDFLMKVKDKLSPQGLLLVEIPNYTLNPFDLIIADHCTHFDMNTVKNLIESSGFEIVFASTEIVPKEMTLLARKNSDSKTLLPISETALANSHRGIIAAIAWLKEIISSASQIASYDELGVFGTSIAGTWLYNEMPDNVSFFVDEDPDRINRSFLGRPVYHPENIPEKSVVFIPFPPVFASGIAERLKIYGNRFVLPPLKPAHFRELYDFIQNYKK